MKVCGYPVVLDLAARSHAQACGLWPFKRIAVGPHWYALPVEERVAVLYHEAGHCRAWHMEARVLMTPFILLAFVRGWWRGIGDDLEATKGLAPQFVRRALQEQEISADRFAAERGWASALARFIDRHPRQESPFYPSNAVRSAILRAREYAKEASCRP